VDLLSCRNLLIYLDTSLRKPLIHLLHYALRPSGFLLLGTSETLHGFDDLFATVDNRCKVFQRNDMVGVSPFLGYLLSPMMSLKSMQQQMDTPRPPEPLTPLTTLIDHHLLAQYVPPSVIINGHGDIVYFHGRTGAYLQPIYDQPQLNVLTMAHEGLRLPLSNAIRQATRQKGAVVLERVRAKSNGSNALVRVVVQQLSHPERLQGLLQVSFEPLSMSWRPRNWKQILESGRAERDEELQRCQDELQRTRAELVASTEEYQSITEKMQSLNEALGSAKEELQSVNEELRTVNTELQHKIDALSEINDHMVNLLNSDEMTTIFLDSKLHIRGFSPKIREVFRLIPSDIGRPLNDMASTLCYTHLHHDAADVLRTLVPKMQEVHTDTNTWYRMYIRPYRTTYNEIDGVVITLINITQQKRAEEGWQAATAAQRYAEDILQTLRVPLLVLNVELSIVSANRWFYQTFHLTPAEIEGRYIYEIGCGPWDLADLRQRLVNVLQRDEAFENIEMVHHFPHLGGRLIRLNACRMQRQQGEADLILLCMDIEDITSRQGGEV
jgi:two-component system CheB/CheR fusion protein